MFCNNKVHLAYGSSYFSMLAIRFVFFPLNPIKNDLFYKQACFQCLSFFLFCLSTSLFTFSWSCYFKESPQIEFCTATERIRTVAPWSSPCSFLRCSFIVWIGPCNWTCVIQSSQWNLFYPYPTSPALSNHPKKIECYRRTPCLFKERQQQEAWSPIEKGCITNLTHTRNAKD